MLLVFSVSGQKGKHFLTFLWNVLSKNYTQVSSGGSSLPYYEIAASYSWMLMPLCCSGWTLSNLKLTAATSCCGDYLCSWYDQLAFCLKQVMYHLQNLLWRLSSTIVHHYPSVTILGIFSKDSQIQKTILSVTWSLQCPLAPLSIPCHGLSCWLQVCQQWWGIRCNVLSFLITFLPTTGLLLVFVHNATSCYTTYLGYFSCCLFWLCVFVIKNSNALWLHPRSVVFPSLSLSLFLN